MFVTLVPMSFWLWLYLVPILFVIICIIICSVPTIIEGIVEIIVKGFKDSCSWMMHMSSLFIFILICMNCPFIVSLYPPCMSGVSSEYTMSCATPFQLFMGFTTSTIATLLLIFRQELLFPSVWIFYSIKYLKGLK